MTSHKKSTPTPLGYVVDHKEAEVRYAVSPGNYNPKIHSKVRDLRPGETVRGFRLRRLERANIQAASPEVTAKDDK